MSKKVLFKGAKRTNGVLGKFFRDLRFNANLTQEELANILKTDAGTISRIELGKTSIDQLIFDNLCLNYSLNESTVNYLRSCIVVKKKKRLDPIKNNLGVYVKKLRESRNLMAFDISMEMGKHKSYISYIESDNHPFEEADLNTFISILKLDPVETDSLKLLNEYFELQQKIREATFEEFLIIGAMSKFGNLDRESRAKLIYKVRNQYRKEVA